MKLLLTSAGISNNSIKKALESLSNEPLKNLKIAFIPTASHLERGDKSWLIKDLKKCQELFASVDIVDFAVLDKDQLLDRLKDTDLIYVEGGNTGFLMHWILEKGLDKILPKLLKEKIYVGVSAGSIIMTPNLFTKESKLLYAEEPAKWMPEKALGLVNFCIIPHYKESYFPNITDENLKKLSQKTKQPIYALDDESSIKIVDNKIEIISEGTWEKFDN
ncbi:MAG: Type 1 glutamine amidotransferase-like domain-containing protein [Candidatus Peregrinibacteria bacterium]|nr:Type 1 glutamine amidotransferase-like domain-containing protein [Candidatus Peregrinibacteria bacterium]